MLPLHITGINYSEMRNYKYNGPLYDGCGVKYLRILGEKAFWCYNNGRIDLSTHSVEFILNDKNWIPIRTFKDYLKLI